MSKKLNKHVKTKGGARIKPVEVVEAESTDDAPPNFSFHLVDRRSDFCLSNCENNEKIAFIEHIYRLTQLTWLQLKAADRRKLGYEKLSRAQIKAGIPHRVTPDIEEFQVFRFNSGNGRFVGYRSGATFHVIWIDPKLRLYKH